MDIQKSFERIQEVVVEIRNMKNENKLNGTVPVVLEAKNDEDLALLISQQHIIENMAKCKVSFNI